MTNDLTLESARNLTDAQLLSVLATSLSDAADSIARACIAVVVAQERGIQLPVLPEVFRYAHDVAGGRLSAKAAMTLCRYPFTVHAVIGLSHQMQEALADGQKVKIAVRVNGRIQSAERSIWEMTPLQMRLAFTDGQVTPWEQQGEWLLKSGHDDAPAAPRPPRLDKKSNRIVVGTKRYAVEDFHQAFAEAGFHLVPIYKGKKPKVVWA